MKIVFWGTVLLVLLGAGLSLLPVQGYDASADSAVVLTTAEKEYLQLKRSVTFISQTNYPPFEFIDVQGERRGMMIELAQWISSEIGFHARFTDAPFSAAQAAIQNGSADVLTSFFYSEERNKTFDFTQTVFQIPASIFVANDRPDIISIHELQNKKIAIQRGDYAKAFLTEKNISFKEISTENFAEAIVMVISGQADALIGDEQIVLHFLYSQGMYPELKIVGEPLYTGLNSMAVKDGHQLLQSILDKGIDHARATGMLQRLNQKWIGTPLPDSADTSVNWWALWPYAAVFAGLLVAVVLYNLHLRRVVTAKTSELRRSEHRLKAVIDGTDAGAWEWNLKTGETYFNERWAEMLGYRLAELEPANIKVWQRLTHPEDLLNAEALIKRHCEGELDEYRCEMRMRHKQGHWVWILDRGKLYEYTDDGRPLLMAGTHVDITERKIAERALEKKNQEMEQFVYVVSHDLKSPLVTIKTFLRMLQEDIRNNDQEQISKDVEFIHSAANKIDTLLEALLKLSRVGRMDTPAKTLPVAELVDECLKVLGGTLQEQQVTVSVGEMPFALHGDPLHFGQIWQNLVENAVKYMGDQQQPSIEVGSRKQDSVLVFYVRDNGMGVAPEHHQQVFGIFAQLNRNSDGVGLGLALVSKLVAIYGGRVWVESEGEGTGSCFCFTLPQALASL